MANSVFAKQAVSNVIIFYSNANVKILPGHSKRCLSVARDVRERRLNDVVFKPTFEGVIRRDFSTRFSASGVRFFSSFANDDSNNNNFSNHDHGSSGTNHGKSTFLILFIHLKLRDTDKILKILHNFTKC